MVVTIWCAIGMDREGDFAGKTGSRDAPDHDGFLANKLFPGRCIHSRDSRTRSDSA